MWHVEEVFISCKDMVHNDINIFFFYGIQNNKYLYNFPILRSILDTTDIIRYLLLI